MQQRFLGRTGVRVSNLAFGTMPFGKDNRGRCWNTHTSRMGRVPVGWKRGRVVCVRTMAKPADAIEAEGVVDTARSR